METPEGPTQGARSKKHLTLIAREDRPESDLEDDEEYQEYEDMEMLEMLETLREDMEDLGVTTIQEVIQRIKELHARLDRH